MVSVRRSAEAIGSGLFFSPVAEYWVLLSFSAAAICSVFFFCSRRKAGDDMVRRNQRSSNSAFGSGLCEY